MPKARDSDAIHGARQKLPLHPSGSQELGPEELQRYARHLVMPEVGLEGQKRLKRSSALVVGLGGLGGPAAQYLAAAGIGRLGLVDHDVVDLSNLQRQILYATHDVGTPKAEAAHRRLGDLNVHVRLELHPERLTSENALPLFRKYDVVVDASDNFPTRYLVNDASVLAGKPNVYGAVSRFEGHVSVFGTAEGPCYRCLHPKPPPPGVVPSCAQAGVLGALPGIIGALQANEALKLLLGIGAPLAGRLLLLDALDLNVTTLRLRKNPDCVLCGPHPTLTHLIDYEDFCGEGRAAGRTDTATLDPVEVKAMMDRGEDFLLLDVREPHEYEVARIPGSRLIPLREVPQRLGELDPARPIVVHCHSGARSARAAAFLRSKGYRAWNLEGGITAWSTRVDPSIPRY